MEDTRNCLLIEDDPVQAGVWLDILKKAGFIVSLAYGTKDADEILRTKENNYFEIIAVDLGLEPKRDSLEIGTKYALKLREELPLMPIMTYTALSRTKWSDWDFRKVIRLLLPSRISFIYTRHLPELLRFEKAINLTASGCIVISPRPAEFISDAIATKADPLPEKFWVTLKNLAVSKSINEATSLTNGVGRAGFTSRLGDIKKILVDKGEFKTPEGIYKEDLVAWYNINHSKYLRD